MAAAYLHLSTMGNPRDVLVLPYKPQTQHEGLEVQAPASLLSSTPGQQQGTEVHREKPGFWPAQHPNPSFSSGKHSSPTSVFQMEPSPGSRPKKYCRPLPQGTL